MLVKQERHFTLKGRRNCSGELEAGIHSGAYASAVVRAATLIGP